MDEVSPLVLCIVGYLHRFHKLGLLVLLQVYLENHSEVLFVFCVAYRPCLAPYFGFRSLQVGVAD